MKTYLIRLDRISLSILKEVGVLADGMGFRSYVIGGCVRDLILRRKIVDLDLAVEGDAVAVAKSFARLCRGKVVVYPSFSTATVTTSEGRAVDFSMIRKERYAAPGVLPIVSRGNLSEDLFRRDFTVNAMAIAIDPVHFGELIDLYGGLGDLKQGKIRVLHAQSFVDDPTRILRAVRFEQRFGFKIESQTVQWLRRAIESGCLKSVKPQRLFEEFKKSLKEPCASLNVKRLAGLSFFDSVGWPCVVGKRELEMFNRVSRLVHWAQEQLNINSPVQVWLINWMVVCSAMPRHQLMPLFQRLGLSRLEMDKILLAVDSREALKKLRLKNCTLAEAYKLLQNLGLEELLFLGSQSENDSVLNRIKWFLSKGRHIVLKINGEDLKQLGIPSGRIFKTILQEVLFCVVDGQCAGKAQQLAYARKMYQLSQR